QATAGITTSIGAGKALYADDLIAPGGGWIDDGSQCFFSPQGYHVRTFVAREVAWCYSSQQQYANMVITAQAQLLHGGIYGLVFRLNPGKREVYDLDIDSRGEYRFVRAIRYQSHNWISLSDWPQY